MKILVAIPTNGQREDQLEKTIKAWESHTCQPLEFHVTTYGQTWAAGLNDAYRAHPDSDLFVCGSDDMYPENDLWFPACEAYLAHDKSPVPLMKDPRFQIQGGVITEEERQDGDGSHMTNFPVLKGQWLNFVFPLPEELHYFSDNEIAKRLHRHGIATVYAKDFVIIHTWDERGRGAGMGSEEARMEHDRAIYKRLRTTRL